jgi:hypothetical protein
MTSLKQELQGILDGYEGYLKKDNTTKNNGDW